MIQPMGTKLQVQLDLVDSDKKKAVSFQNVVPEVTEEQALVLAEVVQNVTANVADLNCVVKTDQVRITK
ncbi:hypothetical protein [Enterococcus sp. CSURQ0835]|uniref:hypothetical protein n=1 Tax=Enterococcus sp. CSURQ0835 TaxID=2681394 RepID=UPI00135BDE3E|nr:hypothetical protein [Enterococcus sp. CSURQ0835]